MHYICSLRKYLVCIYSAGDPDNTKTNQTENLLPKSLPSRLGSDKGCKRVNIKWVLRQEEVISEDIYIYIIETAVVEAELDEWNLIPWKQMKIHPKMRIKPGHEQRDKRREREGQLNNMQEIPKRDKNDNIEK